MVYPCGIVRSRDGNGERMGKGVSQTKDIKKQPMFTCLQTKNIATRLRDTT